MVERRCSRQQLCSFKQRTTQEGNVHNALTALQCRKVPSDEINGKFEFDKGQSQTGQGAHVHMCVHRQQQDSYKARHVCEQQQA